ncbi:TPA: hypothetical protein DDW35_00725, partial [Candidatus Sumerlaeota bacterium]|nr:hypothetical protein [Candidatus Sumerlaeota bacterium]
MQPTASHLLVQVDLDSLWAVKEVYGLPVSTDDVEHDALFEESMRWFLDAFKSRGIRATFFAIGRDCEVGAKAEWLRKAVDAGHEVACHSYHHRIGLGSLPVDALNTEITRAADVVERAVGVRPQGFRAPGFDASPAMLQAVARAGFAYDSSMLPTYLGGPLRLASRLLNQGGGSGAVKGHYGWGPVWKAPRIPYFPSLECPWRVAENTNGLVELPVAVTRWTRMPVHASIGMALGWGISSRMLRGVLRGQPDAFVYVLHCVDVVDVSELLGIKKSSLGKRLFCQDVAEKRAFVWRALDLLTAQTKSVTS